MLRCAILFGPDREIGEGKSTNVRLTAVLFQIKFVIDTYSK